MKPSLKTVEMWIAIIVISFGLGVVVAVWARYGVLDASGAIKWPTGLAGVVYAFRSLAKGMSARPLDVPTLAQVFSPLPHEFSPTVGVAESAKAPAR